MGLLLHIPIITNLRENILRKHDNILIYIHKLMNNRYIKIHASLRIRKNIWDYEFKKGMWDNIDHTNEDIIYRYIEMYINNGDMLDLGCGSGNTGNELDTKIYRRYVGVDISNEAIIKSILRSKNKKRSVNNSYYVDSIETYVPSQSFNVILFRESIYYIPVSKIKSLLDRYKMFLNFNGVFIVRIYDRYKHMNIINFIDKFYFIIDKWVCSENNDIIIVFK